MADAAAAPRVAGELGGLCMICHDKPAAFGLVCRLSGGAAQWFVHAGVCGDCKGGPGGWGWNHCPFCRSDNPTVAKIVVTNPVDQAPAAPPAPPQETTLWLAPATTVKRFKHAWGLMTEDGCDAELKRITNGRFRTPLNPAAFETWLKLPRDDSPPRKVCVLVRGRTGKWRLSHPSPVAGNQLSAGGMHVYVQVARTLKCVPISHIFAQIPIAPKSV